MVVFIPPVQTLASPAALELGQRLMNVVHEYQQTHPGTSAEEIQAALRIAAMNTAGGARRTIKLALLAGVAAAGLAVALMLHGVTRRGAITPMMPMIAIMVIVLGLLAILVARR